MGEIASVHNQQRHWKKICWTCWTNWKSNSPCGLAYVVPPTELLCPASIELLRNLPAMPSTRFFLSDVRAQPKRWYHYSVKWESLLFCMFACYFFLQNKNLLFDRKERYLCRSFYLRLAICDWSSICIKKMRIPFPSF